MSTTFRVGVTPDFYEDAKGRFEEALTEHLGGAGIDVFPEEPPPPDDPLLALDNVILAPHALAWTEELMRDNGIEACRNILAVSRGELPGGIVNPEVVNRPGFQRKLARFRGRQ